MARLKLTLINYIPLKLILKWITGKLLWKKKVPPPPRWEWPLSTGAPPSPRAAHSATRAGACAYIFGGRHMETRLVASDLIIQLWRKVLGEIWNLDSLHVWEHSTLHSGWMTFIALTWWKCNGVLSWLTQELRWAVIVIENVCNSSAKSQLPFSLSKSYTELWVIAIMYSN